MNNLPKKEVKIKQGQYYRRGDGIIIGPAYRNGIRLDGLPLYVVGGTTYYEDGTLYDNKFNLKAEVKVKEYQEHDLETCY